MQIHFSQFTDHELARLIKTASAELEARLNQEPGVQRVPAQERTIILREPPGEQKDFCLLIKQKLVGGRYITAEDRTRVAEIADAYPEWVKRQLLPTERGTGAWRKARELHSSLRSREL